MTETPARVSPSARRTHLRRIYEKLGTRNRAIAPKPLHLPAKRAQSTSIDLHVTWHGTRSEQSSGGFEDTVEVTRHNPGYFGRK
jgi:hypothetical protein